MAVRGTALGAHGEDLAAAHLVDEGWRIVARNWRPRGVGLRGEIDLVVERDGVVAFVEVKTRRSDAFGGPLVAVTPTKRLKLRRLATAYLSAEETNARTIRFDVIAVVVERSGPRLTHLEAAF
jgi:putative endonuclease